MSIDGLLGAEATAVVFVPGRPAPQGSKRHVGRGILVESSKDLGPWRERVALAAHNEMVRLGRSVADGAVYVTLYFILPRPKSAPKSETPAAVKRPDLDKLQRAILDALTGICFVDDSQVVTIYAHKRIAEPGETAGAEIRVEGVGQ